MQRYCYRLCFF